MSAEKKYINEKEYTALDEKEGVSVIFSQKNTYTVTLPKHFLNKSKTTLKSPENDYFDLQNGQKLPSQMMTDGTAPPQTYSYWAPFFFVEKLEGPQYEQV